MSINPKFQGKGYTKQALNKDVLKSFLDEQNLNYQKIILGVNHKNEIAQKLYEKSGVEK